MKSSEGLVGRRLGTNHLDYTSYRFTLVHFCEQDGRRKLFVFSNSKLKTPLLDPKFQFLVLVVLMLSAACIPVEANQIQSQGSVQPAAPELGDEQIQEVTTYEPLRQTERTGGVTLIGGDEAALREFIQRYFTHLYPAAPEGQTVIHIGQIPENIPVAVPLPDGSVPVASIQEPWVANQIQIILDVPQSKVAFEESYCQALETAG